MRGLFLLGIVVFGMNEPAICDEREQRATGQEDSVRTELPREQAGANARERTRAGHGRRVWCGRAGKGGLALTQCCVVHKNKELVTLLLFNSFRS